MAAGNLGGHHRLDRGRNHPAAIWRTATAVVRHGHCLFGVGFVTGFSIGMGLVLAAAFCVGAAGADRTARAVGAPADPRLVVR